MAHPDRTRDPQTRPRARRRTRNPRATGLLIALAFALIGGGVVLFVALLNKPTSSGSAAATGGPTDAPAPTDITQVGSTTDARIQVADKQRPGRVAADLYFKRLDHAGGGAYDAQSPRAFLYLVDGRTIFVRADTGRVRMPAQSDAPESGEFSGNGLVLVFPPREPGDARPIDPESDTPGLIATFTTASFDTVLLEVSTRDTVTIQTPESSATFLGALVRGNQVQDRLEFARFGPGEFRRHIDNPSDDHGPTPRKPEQAHQPRTRASNPAAGPSPLTAAPDSPPSATQTHDNPAPTARTNTTTPHEVLYRTLFTGGVTLTQATRSLAGQTLTVWSRLIDNKLPDGALGPQRDRNLAHAPAIPRPRASAQRVAPSMPLPATLAAMTLAAGEPLRTLFAPQPTDVVLAWKREVTTAPIAAGAVPRELSDGNHVHARLAAQSADGQGRITLNDSAIGAAGACGILDYAATTRQLSLAGTTGSGAAGTGIDRVDLTSPALGRFVGPNFSIDLGSGIAQVRGGGTLLSLQTDDVTVVPEADPDAPLPESAMRRISWSDQADFAFFPSDGDQSIDGVLKSAAFTGAVLGRDHWSSLSGDFVKLDFDRIEGDAGKARSRPRHLRVEGRALAIGAPSPRHADPDRPLPPFDPHISAGVLDVEFRPRQGNPGAVDPSHITARRDADTVVRVADAQSSLVADSLTADIATPSDGKLVVADFVAEGSVRVDRRDGVWATADKIVASGSENWADLTGEQPVQLGFGLDSLIRGPQVHLKESDGSLQVFGPGTFDHLQPLDNPGSLDPAVVALADPDVPAGMVRVRASWTRGMLFVNQSGRIECHGDSEVSSRSAVEGRVARCERLLLNITPSAPSTPGDQAPTAQPGAGQLLSGMGERRLLSAEMIGAGVEREGGSLASVKAWTFGLSPTGERTFDSVLYLESPRIGADESTGIITVPESGTGLIFDAGRQSAAPGSASASPTIGAAGDTRFRWKKSLSFNRAAGELRMLEGVEVEHLAPNSTEKLTMRCQSLTAGIDASAQGRGRLANATCGGGAIAESGPQLLTADEFVYNGLTDIIRAVSTSDQPVMLTDTRRAAPILAKVLSWDRRADRIEVIEPMPIIAPLGK
ncbi:MAG: hypothetical protein IT438_02260 [Phycisphaerales bacterium]|nr:hypothetical protein [Phycisphaerales bacterium]